MNNEYTFLTPKKYKSYPAFGFYISVRRFTIIEIGWELGIFIFVILGFGILVTKGEFLNE